MATVDKQKIFSVCVCFVLVQGGSLIYASKTLGQDGATLSITAHNQPLKDVTASVANQTGSRIFLDPLLDTLRVSGVYTDIKVEEFFSDILRNQNIVIETDYSGKTLFIRSFGARSESLVAYGMDGDKIETGLPDGFTLADLNELNSRQLQDPRYQEDENSIIFGLGMTIAELDELNRQQAEEYALTDRSDELILGSDLTLNQLNALNKHQIKQEELNVNEEFVLGLGMTINELNNFNMQQHAENEQYSFQHDVIMGSDMTIDELDALNRQQVGFTTLNMNEPIH